MHVIAKAGAGDRDSSLALQALKVCRMGNLHVALLPVNDDDSLAVLLHDLRIVRNIVIVFLFVAGMGVVQGLKVKGLRRLHCLKLCPWRRLGHTALFVSALDSVCDGNSRDGGTAAFSKCIQKPVCQSCSEEGTGGIMDKDMAAVRRHCKQAVENAVLPAGASLGKAQFQRQGLAGKELFSLFPAFCKGAFRKDQDYALYAARPGGSAD